MAPVFRSGSFLGIPATGAGAEPRFGKVFGFSWWRTFGNSFSFSAIPVAGARREFDFAPHYFGDWRFFIGRIPPVKFQVQGGDRGRT